jgi:hypothetical protein
MRPTGRRGGLQISIGGMNTQAKAKASVTMCHLGLQETFDHHDGNDDLGPLGGLEIDDRAPAVTMPAPVAYRGVELFDHHLVWGETGAWHQDHQSPNDLLSVSGGSAMAAGDTSVVTGFVQNFAEDRDDYSIAMSKAIFGVGRHEQTGQRDRCRQHFSRCGGYRFHLRARNRPIEARTLRCLRALGTRLPLDRHSWVVAAARDDRHRRASPLRPGSADRAGPIPWQLRASARAGRGARRRHLVRHRYQCTYHRKTTSCS